MEKNSRKDFLICETFKKDDGIYPKLNLLPLRKSDKYGQLFLGCELIDDEFSKEDGSKYIWRFSKNGWIEKATNYGDLEHLNFSKTDYTLCSKIERKSLEEVFGYDLKNYQKMFNMYAGRAGRIQKYVSPHPQLDRIKGHLKTNYERVSELISKGYVRMKEMSPINKRIALLLTTGAIAVSSIAGIINNQEKDNIVATFERPTVTSDINTPTPFPQVLKTEEMSVSIIDPVLEELNQNNVEISEADMKFEEYSEKIMENIDFMKNSSNTSTKQYKYFHKYSSTLNQELQPSEDGKFSSIEEMLDAYKNNPERFAIYGKRFLEQMSLDYMKLQLSEKYGISDFEKIRLNYEDKGLAYEARVRYDGKDLEVPAYLYHKSSDREGISIIKKVTEGSRKSKVALDEWEDFFKVNELENYTNLTPYSGRFTLEEYNNELLNHAQVLSEKMQVLTDKEKQELAENDYEER